MTGRWSDGKKAATPASRCYSCTVSELRAEFSAAAAAGRNGDRVSRAAAALSALHAVPCRAVPCPTGRLMFPSNYRRAHPVHRPTHARTRAATTTADPRVTISECPVDQICQGLAAATATHGLSPSRHDAPNGPANAATEASVPPAVSYKPLAGRNLPVTSRHSAPPVRMCNWLAPAQIDLHRHR